MIKWVLLFYGLLAASVPVSAQALESGERAVVGFYAIDFSFEPKEPKVGDGVAVVFQLTEAETSAAKNFSHAILRIEQEHVVQLSGKFLSEGNRVLLTNVFARAGSFDVNIQFFDGEKELVGYSFPLVVQDAAGSKADTWDVVNISEATPKTLTPWLAGILIGLILGALLMAGKREIS